ncbi:hypothetical protein PG995_010861 [Apiospora arundinis]
MSPPPSVDLACWSLLPPFRMRSGQPDSQILYQPPKWFGLRGCPVESKSSFRVLQMMALLVPMDLYCKLGGASMDRAGSHSAELMV